MSKQKGKTYYYAMKNTVVGKRAPNVKKDDDDEEDGVMKIGLRKRISQVGKLGAVIKFFFSNAGLVYLCVIYATIGRFVKIFSFHDFINASQERMCSLL